MSSTASRRTAEARSHRSPPAAGPRFDPDDHLAIDPRLGSWEDVRALAAGRDLVADVIVNHVSTRSAPFRDWLARGEASPSAGMFLTYEAVFPAGATEEELLAIYRPRPGLPFTPFTLAHGRRRLVWTTFTSEQVGPRRRPPGGPRVPLGGPRPSRGGGRLARAARRGGLRGEVRRAEPLPHPSHARARRRADPGGARARARGARRGPRPCLAPARGGPSGRLGLRLRPPAARPARPADRGRRSARPLAGDPPRQLRHRARHARRDRRDRRGRRLRGPRARRRRARRARRRDPLRLGGCEPSAGATRGRPRAPVACRSPGPRGSTRPRSTSTSRPAAASCAGRRTGPCTSPAWPSSPRPDHRSPVGQAGRGGCPSSSSSARLRSRPPV